MKDLFILFLMLFCHIVGDYYLQGKLASMKQRKWWKENAPEPLYENDFIVALMVHGFSWAFMIMLPIAVVNKFVISVGFVVMLFVNSIVHLTVDHLKANVRKINLTTDQFIHFLQIGVTYVLLSQY